MLGADVKKRARQIAEATFGNRTMREMLYEDIMRAFAPDTLRADQEREEHERRRYSGCMP
jgi:hypothetical protein